MTRNTLLVDVAIAAILTILVVVLSPGLAVVGLIALAVVVICVVSFVLDARRRKRRRRARRPPSVRGLRELSDAQQRRGQTPRRSSGRPPPRRSRPR